MMEWSNMSTPLLNATGLPADVAKKGRFFVFVPWFGVVISILGGVAIILNALHLYIVHHLPKLRRSTGSKFENHRVFLISLAIIDITVSFLNGSLATPAAQDILFRSRLLCVAPAVLLHTSYLFMSLLVILVAIDRISAIRPGVNYQKLFYVRYFKQLVIAMVTLSAAVYVTAASIFHEDGYEPKGNGPCKMETKDVPWLGLITGVSMEILLISLFIVYIVFIVYAKRHMRNWKGNRNKYLHEVTKTVAVVILVHIICWSPSLINLNLRAAGLKVGAMEYVNVVMMMVNSISNPVAYGITSRQYRRTVIRKFVSIFRNEISNTTQFTSDSSKKLAQSKFIPASSSNCSGITNLAAVSN